MRSSDALPIRLRRRPPSESSERALRWWTVSRAHRPALPVSLAHRPSRSAAAFVFLLQHVLRTYFQALPPAVWRVSHRGICLYLTTQSRALYARPAMRLPTRPPVELRRVRGFRPESKDRLAAQPCRFRRASRAHVHRPRPRAPHRRVLTSPIAPEPLQQALCLCRVWLQSPNLWRAYPPAL